MRKIIFVLLYSFLTIHFLFIGFSLFKRILNDNEADINAGIYFKFFTQSWSMFAPPPTSNVKVYIRYIQHKKNKVDTTQFLDIFEPLHRYQKNHSSAIGRLSYQLYNSGYLIMLANNKFIVNYLGKIDSLKNDPVKANKFIYTSIENSNYHKALLYYIKYVYNKSYSDNYGIDSVYSQYKIANQEYPDFDHRHLNYYDLKNYKLSFWTSRFYKIK